jgi:glycosyltransferase involved in cell wall biosynthesis
MRLLLVTDAWEPQVNGVVRTLRTVVEELRAAGDQVHVVQPGAFRSVPCPTYPEIRLSLVTAGTLGREADRFAPDAVHIATEGTLGLAGRRLCLRRRWPFTTSFHTRFPEYVHARFRVPLGLTYRFLRHFHRPAAAVMVATGTVEAELRERGFANTVRWSRGVDAELFRPDREPILDLPRPIHLYVGRVAVEKNLAAFLELDLPGSKVVVGDGPQRPELARRFPSVHFAGAHHGEALARHYASADLFVFPSRTDTFGLVMLEALASGLPVAAFPVAGPLDVIGSEPVGVLDEDLGRACQAVLAIPRERCRAFALRHDWPSCARLFASLLAPFGPEPSAALDAGNSGAPSARRAAADG